MKIRLTRDSVAMGDDMTAPNEQEFDLDDLTLKGFCQKVWELGYLPAVDGTVLWELKGELTIANLVVSHSNSPKLINEFSGSLLQNELLKSNGNLHFHYYNGQTMETILKDIRK